MSDLPPVPPGALPSGAPPADYPAGPPLAAPHPPVPPGAVRPPSPWLSPPDTEPPASGRRRPWVVIAAVLAVLGLVGATFAAFVDGGGDADGAGREPFERDETADPGAPPVTDAPPATEAPQDLEAAVADIRAFVEAERGLPFLRDVTVELAGDAEFEARLLEDFEEDVADLEVQGRVLEAVGLLEPGTDIVEAMRTLLGAGIVGFYDPETDELVVRGTEATPYVRSVIAHELTHALDDQHFELDRPHLEEAGDESELGFTALVEGTASRIEQAYRDTFTAEEQEQATSEELAIASDIDLFSVPPILFDLIGVPYILGPDLVEAILDDGGQARLDGAYALPPTTSEHVLEPPTYLAGEAAVPVDAPATDGGAAAIDEGVLGALGVAEVLGLSPFTVLGGGGGEAVDGWGGDRYVAWDDPAGGTCLRATIVGDTAADSDELRDAFEEWAADAPFGVDASVAQAGPGGAVTITSCSAA